MPRWCEFVPRADRYALTVLRFETFAFDAGCCERCAAALPPGDGGVAVVAALHRALGEAFGAAPHSAIAGSERVAYVASHGQTMWHDGPRSVTLQLGDAFAIREAVGATVCYDFRSADCAAGGQGAPLVAYVDALLPATTRRSRGAQSRRDSQRHPLAKGTRFGRRGVRHGSRDDVDRFLRALSSGGRERAIDRDGDLAAAGAWTKRCSQRCCPTNTSRDARPRRAGANDSARSFSPATASGWRDVRLDDGLATLTELTAASVASAIEATGFHAGTIDRKRRGRAQSRTSSRGSPHGFRVRGSNRRTRWASRRKRKKRSRSPCSATRRCAGVPANVPHAQPEPHGRSRSARSRPANCRPAG